MQQSRERAIDDLHLIFKASMRTLGLNLCLLFPLMVLSESSVSRKSDYDALLGFVFGAVIGLFCLLFLEWLGRLSPFGNTDWTLIVAWKKSWEERNYLKGVLLTVAMGWWWFIVGVALVLLCLTPLILASSASLGYAGRGLFGRSRCILCGSYPAERVARVCRLCDDGRCFNCGDPFPQVVGYICWSCDRGQCIKCGNPFPEVAVRLCRTCASRFW
jgi:hypothetical protein